MTISELAKRSYQTAIEKGWHREGVEENPVERLAMVITEVCEIIEDLRNGKDYNETYFEGDKPCGVPVECADVLIRLLDWTESHGIDLEKAVELKESYNKTRPLRHGKLF